MFSAQEHCARNDQGLFSEYTGLFSAYMGTGLFSAYTGLFSTFGLFSRINMALFRTCRALFKI